MDKPNETNETSETSETSKTSETVITGFTGVNFQEKYAFDPGTFDLFPRNNISDPPSPPPLENTTDIPPAENKTDTSGWHIKEIKEDIGGAIYLITYAIVDTNDEPVCTFNGRCSKEEKRNALLVMAGINMINSLSLMLNGIKLAEKEL